MSAPGTGVNPDEKDPTPNEMRGFGESDRRYNQRQEENNRKRKLGRRKRQWLGGSGGNDSNNRKVQRETERKLDKEDRAAMEKSGKE